MNSLEKSFSYTKEMMAHKIKTMEESHFKQEVREINDYLENAAHRTVVRTSLTSLSSWYLWNFINEFTQSGKIEYDLLARSTYYGISANKWAYSIGQCSTHYDGALLFSDSSMHLAQLVCLGLSQEAITYCSLLTKMLNGKQFKMFPDNPTFPWFVLDLYLRYNNTPIEESWKYPSEMGAYGRTLENWDTCDKALFEKLLIDLCDFHVSQSDEYEHEGNLLEFSSAQYFLFPPEILMWIRLRHNRGLYVGHPNLHPLLQLEINNLPLNSFGMPADPLLTRCCNKLHKDNPSVNFEFMA